MFDYLKRALNHAVLTDNYTALLRVREHVFTISILGESSQFESKIESRLVKATEPTEASYSIKYLYGIVRSAKPVSDGVGLLFGNSTPIKLDFAMDNGTLSYLLAPRKEEREKEERPRPSS